MEVSDKILSICIPTYNGASSFLKEVLDAATSILYSENDVEVIVSDNCSTDSTSTLLKEYEGIRNFRSFRNKENVGFNGNFQLLSDKYAEGTYCWFVGDDDVINVEDIIHILRVLRKKDVDLLTLRFSVSSSEPRLNKVNNSRVSPIYCSFGKAVDLCHDDANTLCAYMGSVIFDREKFKKYPKDFISNSFDTYFNVFPNAFILGSVFNKSRCAFLDIFAITVLVHSKAWGTDDNIYSIISTHFPNMYNYFISLGIERSDLVETYKSIVIRNLIYGYKRIFTFKRVNSFFFKSVLESYKHPSYKIGFFNQIWRIFISKFSIK